MWKRIQLLLALLILIFIAGLTGPSKLPEGGADPVAGRIANILQLLVMPPFLLLLVANRASMLKGLRAAFLPLLVSLMLIFSTAWSLEPRLTLRRSLIFMFVTLFGVYIGSSLSRFEQINLYGKVVLVTIVGCFVTALFFPDYGVSMDVHNGEWKGLFQHKNILGRQMVFCFALLIGGKPFQSRYLRWVAILGSIALLGLSRSGTGLLGFIAVGAAYLFVKVVRIRDRRTLPLWLAMVPAGVTALITALIFRNSLFAVVGKDSTLTGRTRIWAVAFRGMAESPWLGHGYSTYWRQSIIGRLLPPGLSATHSHDGYFDVILDIGWIGMAILLLTLATYLARVMKRLVNQQIPLSNFTVFGFLIFVVLISLNFTESNLLREHTFLWLPLVSVYTALGLQDAGERQQAIRDTARPAAREELSHQLA